jgi:hypothetical protein
MGTLRALGGLMKIRTLALAQTLAVFAWCSIATAQDGDSQSRNAQGANAQGTDDNDRMRRDYPEKEPAIPDVDPNTPAGQFGVRGQIAISSDVGLFIENTSQSGVDGSTTTLRLHPALDYFVSDNLSFGGFLGIDYTTVSGGHTTTWALGPRVGYNIPFSPRFYVWPKGGFSFASTSISSDTADDTNTTNLALNLFVPVMFHPVQHFFLGFGPALDVDLTGDVKTTTIAGRLTIGGWL